MSVRASLLHEQINRLGPYRVGPREQRTTTKHVACSNYNACLTFAACKSWFDFHCEGCRRANGTWQQQQIDPVTPQLLQQFPQPQGA